MTQTDLCEKITSSDASDEAKISILKAYFDAGQITYEDFLNYAPSQLLTPSQREEKAYAHYESATTTSWRK